MNPVRVQSTLTKFAHGEFGGQFLGRKRGFRVPYAALNTEVTRS